MPGARPAQWLAALALATLFLAGCQDSTASTLVPSGPRAAVAADLWWLMFWVGVPIYALVLAALLLALIRARRRRQPDADGGMDETWLIVGGGVVLPLLVLPILWVATLRAMAAEAQPPAPPALTITITGHQWWYEVQYPEQGVTLTNELRVPAGQTVALRVTSADVIHSFWIPRLMGKIDMLPGVVNERWLVAAEPGSYLVECAEFCGLLHARMQMFVVAEPPAQFAAWLASQQR